MDKKLYFKKLDSLRFVAFLLVMVEHAFSHPFLRLTQNRTIQTVIDSLVRIGGVGVHIFFVISGFLITFLLLREEKNHGSINIGYFYIRRILRIWPLYYLVLCIGIFVLPLFFEEYPFNGSYFQSLFFLNNFDQENTYLHLGVAWSVAIEEQFYLVWPILIILIKNKKSLFAFTLLVFFASIIFAIQNPSEAYLHTFSNLRYLMAGCFGAILYFRFEKEICGFGIMRPHFIYLFILLFLSFWLLSPFYHSIYLMAQFCLPLVYLYFTLNMVVQGDDKKPSLISRLGKYTYGMYLYHAIILVFIDQGFVLLGLDYINNRYLSFGRGVLALLITIVVSHLSYEYFEKIFLNIKNRFAIVRTRV